MYVFMSINFTRSLVMIIRGARTWHAARNVRRRDDLINHLCLHKTTVICLRISIKPYVHTKPRSKVLRAPRNYNIYLPFSKLLNTLVVITRVFLFSLKKSQYYHINGKKSYPRVITI